MFRKPARTQSPDCYMPPYFSDIAFSSSRHNAEVADYLLTVSSVQRTAGNLIFCKNVPVDMRFSFEGLLKSIWHKIFANAGCCA